MLSTVSNQTPINISAAATVTPALTTTGLATDDLVLLILCLESTATVTPTTATSGWTKYGQQQQSTTGVTVAIFRRFYNSGTYANPVITWTGSYNGGCHYLVIRGADLTTPIEAGTGNSGTVATQTASSALCATTGATRLITGYNATNTLFTAFPLNFQLLQNVIMGPPAGTNAVKSAYISMLGHGYAANAQGAWTWTGAAASWVTWQLFLRPATPDTIGLLRSAGGRTASAATVTATLPADGVNGTVAGVTRVVCASTWTNTFSGVTIGGTAATQVQNQQNNNMGVGIFYLPNLSAVNGTSVACVASRTGATADTIEAWASEWVGLDTAAPKDGDGYATSAASATVTVSTTNPTAAATELSIGITSANSADTTSTVSTNYSVGYYQKTNTGASSLFGQYRIFTGGGTETISHAQVNAGYSAAIATFTVPTTAAPVMQAMGVWGPI